MVFKPDTECTEKSIEEAKITFYVCAVEILHTDIKGMVLINMAEKLKNFSKSEENLLDQQIKVISNSGTKVSVGGAMFAI